jgi:hypothetical protein
MTTPPNQFTSLDQAAIFILGRLEGIAGSSRHNLEYEVATEVRPDEEEENPTIVLTDRRYKNLTQLNRDLEEAIAKDPY